MKGPFFDSIKLLVFVGLVAGATYFIAGYHSTGNTASVVAPATTATSTAGTALIIGLTVNGVVAPTPVTLTYNQEFTVSWASENATTCSNEGTTNGFVEVNGGGIWDGPTTTSGSVELYARGQTGTADTSFDITLQCFSSNSNGDGMSVTHSKVTVTIPPPTYPLQVGTVGVSPVSPIVPPNDVYVVDAENNRIQEFTLTGVYVAKWGTANGQSFFNPEGIALAPSGNLYVVDTGNNRIQEFTAMGAYISGWGTKGDGNGQFNQPVNIAVAPSGNLYVVDTGNNRIQEFTAMGAYIGGWGTLGSGNGQFYYPIGVAVSSSGDVYVTDGSNNRIQEFTADGAYITQFGNAIFSHPYGIAIAPSGNVYVADANNNDIKEFDSSGNFITEWGGTGSNSGQFVWPYDIAIDSSGNVYVTDRQNNRIQEFMADGNFITKWGIGGNDNGQFNAPTGIALAP